MKLNVGSMENVCNTLKTLCTIFENIKMQWHWKGP